MKNLFTVLLGFLIAVMIPLQSVQAVSFSDVRSPILSEAVNYLNEKGIIKGYPDGTFKPDQTINRAEALKIIFESLGESDVTLSSTTESSSSIRVFPDVDPTQWFAKYVKAAKQKSLIKGYPDGSYKPTQFVNRAEFIKIAMLAQSHYQSIQNTIATTQYSDLADGEWYVPYVAFGVKRDFLDKSDKLRPTAAMSRGDAAMIIYRIAQYNEANPTASNSAECDPAFQTETCVAGRDLTPFPELLESKYVEVTDGKLMIDGIDSTNMVLNDESIRIALNNSRIRDARNNTSLSDKAKEVDEKYQSEYTRILGIYNGSQPYEKYLGNIKSSNGKLLEGECIYKECRLETEFVGYFNNESNFSLTKGMKFEDFVKTDQAKGWIFDLMKGYEIGGVEIY